MGEVGRGHNGRVRLDRRHAALLLAVAGWNVLTWLMFAENLADAEGRPTGYYVAHSTLIVVNLGIAAVLATLGRRAWKEARADD